MTVFFCLKHVCTLKLLAKFADSVFCHSVVKLLHPLHLLLLPHFQLNTRVYGLLVYKCVQKYSLGPISTSRKLIKKGKETDSFFTSFMTAIHKIRL